jgi:hypothetical protein
MGFVNTGASFGWRWAWPFSALQPLPLALRRAAGLEWRATAPIRVPQFDPAKIVETVTRLRHRIRERFPIPAWGAGRYLVGG